MAFYSTSSHLLTSVIHCHNNNVLVIHLGVRLPWSLLFHCYCLHCYFWFFFSLFFMLSINILPLSFALFVFFQYLPCFCPTSSFVILSCPCPWHYSFGFISFIPHNINSFLGNFFVSRHPLLINFFLLFLGIPLWVFV